MAKNTPPTGNPAVDPFKVRRPFNPFPAGSPVTANAQRFAPRITVIPVEEQTRATGIPNDIRDGRAAPSFASKPTPPPFTARTDAPVPVKPQAGGSKS